MTFRLFYTSVLLFGSGLCALVYQVAWLRELKLIFGASTAASGAVLAIFMGGLGLGGALLGKYADRSANPLRLYGLLEAAITALAFVTPFMLDGVRAAYLATGGVSTLGLTVATLVRLGLAALVLGAPTVLMGGTLPAAARAVETFDDFGRRRLAWLYGLNTLGAVLGAVLVTFLLLERLGTRQSLWFACLINALVATTALAIAQSFAQSKAIPPMPASDTEPRSRGGVRLRSAYAYGAAAGVGFVFFLMELVWYRLSAPILGGTTFTFGLILAVALFGIGSGGALYALVRGNVQATFTTFSSTLAIQAVCLVLPLVAGDRLAILAALVRTWDAFGFDGLVSGWTLVVSILVFPAACVAGFQFPLLISLLGEGGEDVGVDTGRVYAFNTFGAVAGSLAGGFGLLPLLTAPGAWRLCVVLLAVMSFASLLVASRGKRSPAAIAGIGVLIVISVTAAARAVGPTAFWRHSGIGVGWVEAAGDTPNELHERINNYRSGLALEREGRETSVGIMDTSSYSFIVNGKVDGNATGDGSTQVMMAMISAILHPEPKRSLVIGLGTGSSAGWLGAVPSMEHVDVAELEPAVLEMAKRCGPVNLHVLDNEKVDIHFGDGREFVLTTDESYDLIVSAPSNPYRAGIASMYTQEFYASVSERLAPGGMFSQWVQAYDVDGRTIQTVYATLRRVFPYVSTWQTNSVDLLLVCSNEPMEIDAEALRRRIQGEPFKAALYSVWRVVDAEGFLSRYVANPAFGESVAAEYDGAINSDNRMLLEYGFARTLDTVGLFSIESIWRAARAQDQNRPAVTNGAFDWELVDYRRTEMHTLDGERPPTAHLTDPYRKRALVQTHYVNGSLSNVLNLLDDLSEPPETPIELLIAAWSRADSGIDSMDLLPALAEYSEAEAAVVRGHYLWRLGRWDEAVEFFAEAFRRARNDPWITESVLQSALDMAGQMARTNAGRGEIVLQALSHPFSVNVLDKRRRLTLLDAAIAIGPELGAEHLETFEPFVPWNESFLSLRHNIYRTSNHPLASQARQDLFRFLENEPSSVDWTLDEATEPQPDGFAIEDASRAEPPPVE